MYASPSLISKVAVSAPARAASPPDPGAGVTLWAPSLFPDVGEDAAVRSGVTFIGSGADTRLRSGLAASDRDRAATSFSAGFGGSITTAGKSFADRLADKP